MSEPSKKPSHLHIQQPAKGECALCEMERADRLETELSAARVPLCVGRPIIQILAAEGQYLSDDGRGLIAADCLFQRDPYKENDTLRSRLDEAEKDKERLISQLRKIRKLNCTDEILNPSMTMVSTEAIACQAIDSAMKGQGERSS